VFAANKENSPLCFVFPMGIEAHQFIHRLEVRRRWNKGKATYREAFFEGTRLLVVRCGIGPDRAAAAVRNLDISPSGILCVGAAGGLVPHLKIGDMVVSSDTLFAHDLDHVCKCPSPVVEALASACRSESLTCKVTRVVTARNAVFVREERQSLHETTGAEAVDMESHAIGLEAMRLSVPFTSLRVISDDLDSPPLPDWRDLKALWSNPFELRENLGAMVRWWTFLRTFRRVVGLLHPVLVRMIRNSGKCLP
jgi:adenosylhomocysteine nucleosidase